MPFFLVQQFVEVAAACMLSESTRLMILHGQSRLITCSDYYYQYSYCLFPKCCMRNVRFIKGLNHTWSLGHFLLIEELSKVVNSNVIILKACDGRKTPVSLAVITLETGRHNAEKHDVAYLWIGPKNKRSFFFFFFFSSHIYEILHRSGFCMLT